MALEFAISKQTDDKVSIVFEIDFRGDKGLFKLTGDYSAYPEEEEVLIQDGFEYMVTSHKELTELCDGKYLKYRLIKLRYPAKGNFDEEKH